MAMPKLYLFCFIPIGTCLSLDEIVSKFVMMIFQERKIEPFLTPVYPKGSYNHPCLLVRGPLVYILSLNIPRDRSLVFSNFGPQVYPKGSLVNTLVVCLSLYPFVRQCVLPYLNISFLHQFLKKFFTKKSCKRGGGTTPQMPFKTDKLTQGCTRAITKDPFG